MAQPKINLTELSLEQLKSLAYDQAIAQKNATNNLMVIENEIQRRQSIPSVTEPVAQKSAKSVAPKVTEPAVQPEKKK